ncbi:CoB-CoM heterodisulfide reductase HdrA2 [Methermicoccus shengliensis]|uniref:CoB--CoM heterodisulfide reductase iron-sulfur subunit A n=1 Tax=Methermicoccus shengliensis TaxID=660064 RepID=A0A832RVL7_9EURY|nr:CoB-CoM heterodisulfide reductase HdrA2 [Methermicoccus shengliensis]KUK04670.1 MAG: CoB--CoM heterodisulfide reductase subunit A [Euryarchaeota archaeon 55_53]KUK30797.1 MAG: CoB--CoM heterodisulfide reductase subunit A [Methanosarcinales archeaon 56_1174]MDI3487936.1 heterodisulfide reductase subunit [Methanosarcinales archaeon]MDN5295074.1 heterodisulfide reductase subunit [Methanosarcinales archaeon]HIH69098.1 hydrogenase iron-sulfur subunit [Methermicoccus shengliensis]
MRIGVFVCHCGQNIAGALDTSRVLECALSEEGVAHAEELQFACSQEGQRAIQSAIVEHKLDRIVVAACSPHLHEPTFRRAVEGLINPYLVECTNIREQCSWVHTDRARATRKACDLVRMGIARARHLEPLKPRRIVVNRDVLVIGGGVAGITAALELANADFHVHLVERNSSLGGKMALLDKVFPTGDCSICVFAPKMSEAYAHPNITVHTYTEVEDISGHVGSFRIKLRHKPRYINEYCKGCIELCSSVCPVEVPNEFDFHLSKRKAIYKPFAQAVPEYAVIDPEACVGCGLCRLACPLDAVDYEQKESTEEVEVGAIIVATGYSTFDPARKPHYHFSEGKDVITSAQLERMLSASGPTGGTLVQPSSMSVPKSVAFVQCVGSRDEQVGNAYCSRVCCMSAIKNALQIKERHPEVEVSVHYLDVRACGEGYEEMYLRAQKAGVRFIRGLPGEIIPAELEGRDGGADVLYEDTLAGRLMRTHYDLVVLSVGMESPEEAEPIARMLNLRRRDDRFLAVAHPKMRPAESVYRGIFLAGCATGPKEIQLSITQAGEAASRAMSLLSKGVIEADAYTAVVDAEKCIGCGICESVCPSASIQLGGNPKRARVDGSTCIACGTCIASCPADAIDQKNFTDSQILSQIRAIDPESEYPLIVAFLCNWCAYGAADLAGISKLKYPPNVRIIRVMCSGRVDPQMVLEALKCGADGVLIGGCRMGECHYQTGNCHCEARMEALREMLAEQGISPDRIATVWVSANESQTLIEALETLIERVEQLGPVGKEMDGGWEMDGRVPK